MTTDPRDGHERGSATTTATTTEATDATHEPPTKGLDPTRDQRLALALDRNLAVTAGAGTGKTFVLTQRYLRILETSGGELGPQHILAVTFTRKAASEMRTRIGKAINERIARARADQDEEDVVRWNRHRRRLRDAMITTIHGLASEILRSHTLEAGVDPDHTVLDEPTRIAMRSEAVDDAIEAARDDDRRALADWLTVRSTPALRGILEHLLDAPDILDGWLETLATRTDEELLDALADSCIPYDATTANQTVQHIHRAAEPLLASLAVPLDGAAGTLLDRLRDLEHLDGAPLRTQAHALHRLLDHITTKEGLPYAERSRHFVRGSKPLWKDHGGTELVDTVIETCHDALVELYPDPNERPLPPGPVDDAALRDGRRIAHLAEDAREHYRDAKRRQAALDFDDLQRHALRLVQEHPAVTHALRCRWRHLLVDEFQDTDATQWGIIRAIARHDPDAQPLAEVPTEVAFDPDAWGNAAAVLAGADTAATTTPQPALEPDPAPSGPAARDDDPELAPDRLFIVGDEKQSIYGFRGADVRVYKASRHALATTNRRHARNRRTVAPAKASPSTTTSDRERGTEPDQMTPDERDGLLRLQDNFRTLPNIVRFVNHVADMVMRPRGGEPEHAADEAAPGALNAKRTSKLRHDGTVRLLLTPYAPEACDPGPDDEAHSAWHDTARLDSHELGWRKVAQTILADVTGAEPLEVHDVDTDEPRPLRYDDIGILLSASTHIDTLLRALREHGIPYTVSGGRGFWDNQEVWDLTNLLVTLADPRRDVELAGILRSPLFAWTDEALILAANHDAAKDRRHLWAKLRALADADIDLGPERTPTDIRTTVDTLQRWQREIGTRDIHSTLTEIVNERRYLAALAADDRREQAIQNVEKLIQTVRDLEKRVGPHPTRIARELEHVLDSDIREGEANVTPTESHGVRIMTVHASKGLEFPYVVVPMTERTFQHGRLERGWHQGPLGAHGPFVVATKAQDPTTGEREDGALHTLLRAQERRHGQAEMKRQLYVAMTRARDHLVLHGRTKHLDQPPARPAEDATTTKQVAVDGAPLEPDTRAIDTANDWLTWLLTTLHLNEDVLHRIQGEPEPRRTLNLRDAELTVDLQPPTLTHSNGHFETEVATTSAPNLEAHTGEQHQPAVQFSPSALETWRTCAARFRYRTIDRIIEPRPRAAQRRRLEHATAIGNLVHEALEEGATPEEPLPSPTQARLRRTAARLERNPDGLTEQVERHVKNALEALGSHDDRERTVHELGFDVEVADRIRIHGMIDRLTRIDTDAWRLTDYKTDTVQQALEAHAEAAGHTRQVGTYGAVVTKQGGDVETELLYTGPGQRLTVPPRAIDDVLDTIQRSHGADEEELQRLWPRTEDASTCDGCAYLATYGGPCPGAKTKA